MREALRLLSASHLIRVGRGRTGGDLRRAHAERGHEPQPVSESIALMLAAQTHLDGPSCSTPGSRSRCRSPAARRSTPTRGSSSAWRRRSRPPPATSPAREPFNAADSRFHQILAEAAGNDLLHALTAWILEVLQPSLVATISVRVDAEAILAQHRAILRAVRRRQRLAAERAMQAHIEYLAQILDEGE